MLQMSISATDRPFTCFVNVTQSKTIDRKSEEPQVLVIFQLLLIVKSSVFHLSMLQPTVYCRLIICCSSQYNYLIKGCRMYLLMYYLQEYGIHIPI